MLTTNICFKTMNIIYIVKIASLITSIFNLCTKREPLLIKLVPINIVPKTINKSVLWSQLRTAHEPSLLSFLYQHTHWYKTIHVFEIAVLQFAYRCHQHQHRLSLRISFFQGFIKADSYTRKHSHLHISKYFVHTYKNHSFGTCWWGMDFHIPFASKFVVWLFFFKFYL